MHKHRTGPFFDSQILDVEAKYTLHFSHAYDKQSYEKRHLSPNVFFSCEDEEFKFLFNFADLWDKK